MSCSVNAGAPGETRDEATRARMPTTAANPVPASHHGALTRATSAFGFRRWRADSISSSSSPASPISRAGVASFSRERCSSGERSLVSAAAERASSVPVKDRGDRVDVSRQQMRRARQHSYRMRPNAQMSVRSSTAGRAPAPGSCTPASPGGRPGVSRWTGEASAMGVSVFTAPVGVRLQHFRQAEVQQLYGAVRPSA